jgi:peptidoglycan/LPS O-acetylase OafA/YrhL
MKIVPSTKSHHIPGLDGIRAIAILIVLVGHFAVRFRGSLSRFGIFYRLLGSGVVGVDLFFVLSGFLITTLLLKEYEVSGRIRLSHFYIRRAFRILPAFYVYLLVIALLNHFAGWRLPEPFFLSAGLFLSDYGTMTLPWLLAHTWSLAVEEQFYIIWPLLLIVCLKCGGRRLAIYAALVLVALATAARLYDCMFQYDRFLLRDFRMLHTKVDILMFGCLAALMSGNLRFETRYKNMARFWWICPVWFLFLGNLATRIGGVNFRLTLGLTLNGMSMAAFILYVSRTPGGWLGRSLNFRPVAIVGVLSYSIYLWQQLFTTPENTTWASRMPGMLVCLAVVPLLSYLFVEQPALRLRNRCLGVFGFTAPKQSEPSVVV